MIAGIVGWPRSFLLAGVLVALGSVTPPRSSVSGRVLSYAESSAPTPVKNARVSLEDADGRTVQQATDASGAFAFTGISSGLYRLRASSTNHSPMEYGAFRSGEQGTPLVVSSSSVSDLEIQLPRDGSLSGIVTTWTGQVAPNVEVTAETIGGRSLGSSKAFQAVTESDGRFRVYGLAPGRYRVSARPDSRSPATYLPGTVDPSQATLLQLAAGADVGLGILSLAHPGDASISGALSNANGRLTNGCLVRIDNVAGLIKQTTSTSAGTFLITGVQQGRYRLAADCAASTAGPTGAVSAQRDIEIAQGQSAAVDLMLYPQHRLSGRIVVEGPVGLAQLPPVLLDGHNRAAVPLRVDVQSGTFSAEVFPGVYQIGFRSPQGPQTPWVKSVVVAGQTVVLDNLAVQEAGASVLDMTVVLSNQRSTVRGVLRDRNDSPTFVYWIGVVPTSPQHRYPGSPHVTRVRPNTNGGYEIRDLPIGDYRLVVLGPDADSDWTEGASLEALAKQGIPISVQSGKVSVQDLRIQR